MDSHAHSNGDVKPFVFPSLPIVTPDPPRKSTAEKYGGLFYLGSAGLLVLLGLITWFSWEVWTLRSVWTNVYILNDGTRSDLDRNRAAHLLSRDPGVNARQLFDLALDRRIPPLARYLVAEALPAEAAEADPRGYVLMVARSEGWPGWLRVLLARPIAYAVAEGHRFPRDPLVELARNPDPAVSLWATFALARGGDVAASASLRESAEGSGESKPMAQRLLAAHESLSQADRIQNLDAATLWLRDHHPDAITVWKGWVVRMGQIDPDSAP